MMHELTEDGVRADANNIVLVFEWVDGELRDYAFTEHGQVYIRRVIIRDGVAHVGLEHLTFPIEDGMTAAQYAENILRDFPDPHTAPATPPPDPKEE